MEDLFEASNFINSIEKRQDSVIASIEEVSFSNGWMSERDFKLSIKKINNSSYGESLYSKYFGS